MANILDLRTVGDNTILVVDADPSTAGGTEANTSSIAMLDLSGVGHFYLKVGPLDTEWTEIASNGTLVNSGTAGNLALYAATGPQVSDTYQQNSQNINISIASMPTRSAAIDYIIPNPGDAITSANFILDQGPQTIYGTLTVNNDTVINGDLTVTGTTTAIDSTNLVVTDKLFTVNKGGLANSGGNAGFNIEEGGVITGYLTTDTPETGWLFKAPASDGALDLSTAALTANRTLQVQDLSGYIAVQDAPGVAMQVPFFDSNLELTSENGVGAASLAWDTVNKRLGIGTSTPAATLDVNGASIFRGDLQIIDNNGVNYEIMTGNCSTTDATPTTIETVATLANQTLLVEIRVVARRTGGTAGSAGDSAGYIRTFLVENIAGTVSVEKYDSMYTAEDQNPWDIQPSISGSSVLLQVVGAANNNIQWYAITIVQTN